MVIPSPALSSYLDVKYNICRNLPTDLQKYVMIIQPKILSVYLIPMVIDLDVLFSCVSLI